MGCLDKKPHDNAEFLTKEDQGEAGFPKRESMAKTDKKVLKETFWVSANTNDESNFGRYIQIVAEGISMDILVSNFSFN